MCGLPMICRDEVTCTNSRQCISTNAISLFACKFRTGHANLGLVSPDVMAFEFFLEPHSDSTVCGN